MSENQQPQPEQPAAPETPPRQDAKAEQAPRPSGWRFFNSGLVVALLALGLAGWQWVDAQHRMGQLEQALGKRLADFDAYNKQSRVLATQAQENTREALVKLGLLESKLADAQNQQVALEALYQELSRSRDEWTLADIEQMLSIASQQLQLSGNVKAALIALEAADARLQRADKPQFIGLRKAINKDIERLKALPFVDTVGISLRLDELIAEVDKLPLAFEAKPKAEAAAPEKTSGGGWWARLGRETWQDIKQLIQIKRMDEPNAPPLLPPSQAYFVRENLKLHLLTARIALLQRDEASYKADLKAARESLSRYFDVDDKATQAALTTLRQLANSPISIELPDISSSLDALRNYKLTHERGTH